MSALHENVGPLELLPDLARAVHGIAAPAGISVAIESVGSVEYVPPALGFELCAVAEAAVANVAAHSGAESVVVTIAADDAGVWLRVADDGRGLNDALPGGGMADMLARARRLGGSCSWTPAAPSGTVVDFRAPLVATPQA
jgi:signal transduction histidine kinase